MQFRRDNYPILNAISKLRDKNNQINIFKNDLYDQYYYGSDPVGGTIEDQPFSHASVILASHVPIYFISNQIFDLLLSNDIDFSFVTPQVLSEVNLSERGIIIYHDDGMCFCDVYDINTGSSSISIFNFQIEGLNIKNAYQFNNVTSPESGNLIRLSFSKSEFFDDMESGIKHKLSEQGYDYQGIKKMFAGNMKAFLVKFLYFKKFIQTEVKIVNRLSGKVRLANDKYKSDFDIPIEIIDSTWFTEIIRTEGFGVRGHLRLQPCGAGMADRKLIYIKPFKKNGYHRKARKDLLKNGNN